MARRPIAIRLPEETINGLDRLVEQGWYVTRTEGIEDALTFVPVTSGSAPPS